LALFFVEELLVFYGTLPALPLDQVKQLVLSHIFLALISLQPLLKYLRSLLVIAI
jgi:hypothetical protein